MTSKKFTAVEVEAVRSILRDHVGKDNAITSSEIAEKFDLDTHDSTPNTRAIIRHLVTKEGMPIAASGKGYYVIEDEEELEEYGQTLTNRADKIIERRQAVTEAFYA